MFPSVDHCDRDLLHVLGYKLFLKGVGNDSTNTNAKIEFAAAGNNFTIGNAAPGTAFALFGAGLLIAMTVQDSPSVVFGLFSKSKVETAAALEPGPSTVDLSQEAGPITPAKPTDDQRMTKGKKSAEQKQDTEQRLDFVMKGSHQFSIALLSAQGKEYEQRGDTANAERSYYEAVSSIAEPINALAWLYLQSGHPGDALSLASIAVQLDPREEKYKDTHGKAKLAVH